MSGALALDLATAFVFASATQTSIALLMIFVYRAQDTYPGFGHWAAGFVAAATGFALVAGRDKIDPLLSRLAASLVLLCIPPLEVEGLLRFLEVPRPRLLRLINLATMLLAMAGFTWLYATDPRLPGRMLALAAGYSVGYGLLIWIQLRSELARSLPATRILLGCMVVGLLLNLSRIVALLLSGQAVSNALTSDGGLALTAVFSTVLTVIAAFGMLSANSERLEQELRRAQAKLEHLASIDPLTELRNRRSFLEEGGRLVALALRHHRPLTVMVADVDHFKRVNDTYGHRMGDRVLTMVAEAIVGALRQTDLVGRLGGEEFGIVLMETDACAAALGAERVRRAVAAIRPPWAGHAPITISIGVASITPETVDLDHLVQRADDALYAAKRAGRDRWVMAG